MSIHTHIRALAFAAFSVITLHSCETEFDLTGQYVDKAVVYALVDPLDNPAAGGNGHLFRIQKMFLGEASAFDMALVPDSSYFPYEATVVNLVEYGTGNSVVRFPMDTITIDTKVVGDPADDVFDFFAPKQRLYKSMHNIDPTKEYALEVFKLDLNTQDTLYRADSRISIINTTQFRFENPFANSSVAQQMDIYSPSSQTYKDYPLRFRTAGNARMYEIWLRFHYREVKDGVTTPKSVFWRAAVVSEPPTLAGQTVQAPLNGESIVRRIGELVPVDANAIRIIGIERVPEATTNRDIDVEVRIGGQSLYEYFEINSASNTGVVQDKPVYSNINNGIGLFSSRTSDRYEGVYLSSNSLTALESSTYTAGRNFVKEQ